MRDGEYQGTTPGQVNYNTNDAVDPMWMLSKNDYWFHHFNNVRVPPYGLSEQYRLTIHSAISFLQHLVSSLNCAYLLSHIRVNELTSP